MTPQLNDPLGICSGQTYGPGLAGLSRRTCMYFGAPPKPLPSRRLLLPTTSADIPLDLGVQDMEVANAGRRYKAT